MQCACWESCAGDLFHAHMYAWVRILHMYRAFDVSPWRHVSGVHSDTEAERGKPQLNSRQSEGVTAILSRAGAIKGSLLFRSACENAYQSESIQCACM